MALQNKIVLIMAFCMLQMPLIGLSAQEKSQTGSTPVKYVSSTVDSPKPVFFQGFSLSADVFSLFQHLLSDYGGLEGSMRINLKNTYFPAFEAGLSSCDHTDSNTSIHYKTSAPYFRIGLDFNLLKDKFQENRLFMGLRYGFSNFNYDISGPSITDPIWGGSSPFSYKDINTTSHWFEICMGTQVKILGCFHMGWSVRYKKLIGSSSSDVAEPYFIPGYGVTTNESTWGATYTLLFDLNWGKKHKSQHVNSLQSD